MTKIMEGAEAFRFEAEGRPAVLVLHGFTGSTQSMRYLGEELHRRFGFHVCGPRLAGHGTSPDDMATTGFLDWLGTAEAALREMAATHRKVFVTGLSMGGTLSLNLAARFPDLVAGIIPINGCGGRLSAEMSELVLANDAPERVPGIGSDIKAAGVAELAYSEVPVSCVREANALMGATGNLLGKILCPTLVIQSREDHVLPPSNGSLILQSIGSRDARILWLEDSYHVATLDNDKDLIVERTGRFISEIASDGGDS
ncbi:MAG: carboxylesterase [Hoeflea sp.]|uniref:alpha/beta hydrolase n=1 Tax=Hoeflea sp. TaxID=1940281 RepID=UPI000C1171BD|nr:alpha/beta fold hydrolase [Hoeflea sp.]PHR25453.1 MAG: carboxylesterase [Hoeflea sp.]